MRVPLFTAIRILYRHLPLFLMAGERLILGVAVVVLCVSPASANITGHMQSATGFHVGFLFETDLFAGGRRFSMFARTSELVS